jgi:hypothetical protein
MTPIAGLEVRAHCDAIPPTVKHAEPTMNRTAIHQLRRCGRHQTEPEALTAP